MGGAGGASSVGPKPEVLGLATLLAAMVGLGSLWIFTRRRRRGPNEPVPAAMKAKVAPPTPAWTNVRLDDNDALPPWLRAIAESERAPLAGGAPLFTSEAARASATLLEAEPLVEDEPLRPREPLSWNEPALQEAPLSWNEPALQEAPLSWNEPALQEEPLFPPLPRHEPPLRVEPLLENELSPFQEPPARLAQTFAEPIEEGAMRLVVTAAQTELLDQPDDDGEALTTLIAGDEVEIQDLAEPWVRVLIPLGASGWIPSASLGVGGAAPDEANPDAQGELDAQADPDAQGELDAPPESKRRHFRMPRRSGSTRPAT